MRFKTTRRSKSDLNYYICGRVYRCLEQKYQKIYTTYTIFLMNMYLLICTTNGKSIVTQRAVFKKAALFNLLFTFCEQNILFCNVVIKN